MIMEMMEYPNGSILLFKKQVTLEKEGHQERAEWTRLP